MISENFKNIIVKTLGKKYSPVIKKHLDGKGIKNEDGNSFSIESIRLLVGGFRENKEVERSIIDLVEMEVAENAKAHEKLNKMLLNT